MIDPQGKLVGEGEGDMTIGFYEGRSSLRKIKEAVRSFAHYELEQLKLKGNVPLENIELKDSVEMERILSKVRSERYEHLKGLR